MIGRSSEEHMARLLCVLICSSPVAVGAHHSIGGNYDPSTVIEVEGEVTEVLWRNPHVQVTLRVTDANGATQVWDMATTSLSNIRRWQIEPDFIAVGDRIRVAGNPAHRAERSVYISQVLTRTGAEVLLSPSVAPRWSDQTVAMAESRRLGVGDPSRPELGIYRVWSTPDTIPMLIPRNFGRLEQNRTNLTDAARHAVDTFVWERDNPLKDCAPKGMPTIMEAPYPFEFVQDGEVIRWHNEEYDTVRVIHLTSGEAATVPGPSLLGHSIGRWADARTLVVTTTAMGWGHFDGAGVPLSPTAVLVERFTLSPQGDRLDYEATLTDAEVFVEPLVLRKHWVWYPDAAVGAYECLRAAED